jgi:hypothetical protein
MVLLSFLYKEAPYFLKLESYRYPRSVFRGDLPFELLILE